MPTPSLHHKQPCNERALSRTHPLGEAAKPQRRSRTPRDCKRAAPASHNATCFVCGEIGVRRRVGTYISIAAHSAEGHAPHAPSRGATQNRPGAIASEALPKTGPEPVPLRQSVAFGGPGVAATPAVRDRGLSRREDREATCGTLEGGPGNYFRPPECRARNSAEMEVEDHSAVGQLKHRLDRWRGPRNQRIQQNRLARMRRRSRWRLDRRQGRRNRSNTRNANRFRSWRCC